MLNATQLRAQGRWKSSPPSRTEVLDGTSDTSGRVSEWEKTPEKPQAKGHKAISVVMLSFFAASWVDFAEVESLPPQQRLTAQPKSMKRRSLWVLRLRHSTASSNFKPSSSIYQATAERTARPALNDRLRNLLRARPNGSMMGRIR